jgi:alpha-ribazole phosphatase
MRHRFYVPFLRQGQALKHSTDVRLDRFPLTSLHFLHGIDHTKRVWVERQSMQAPYQYKRLWLMRHGETYMPARDAHAPREQEVVLSTAGVQQIEALAEQLQDIAFDAIYASGMTRTLQTAQLIADRHRLPVLQAPDLQEMPLATVRGATLRDVSMAYIDICRQLAVASPDEVLLPGPISFGALCRRYVAAIHRIMQPPAVEQALVVAHGGVNRLLLCTFLGLPYTHLLRFEQDNGCVNMIDFVKRGCPYVRLINHTMTDPWKTASPFRPPFC